MNKSGPSDNEIKEMSKEIAVKLLYIVSESAKRDINIIKYIDKEKLSNDNYPLIYNYLYDINKFIKKEIKNYKKNDEYSLEQHLDDELCDIICTDVTEENSLMDKILQPYIKIAGGVHYSDDDSGTWDNLRFDVFNYIKKNMMKYY
jgi:hypothetical protein